MKYSGKMIAILALVCGPAVAAGEMTDPAGTGRAEPGPIVDPQFQEFVVVMGRSPHESRLQVRVLDRAGRPDTSARPRRGR